MPRGRRFHSLVTEMTTRNQLPTSSVLNRLAELWCVLDSDGESSLDEGASSLAVQAGLPWENPCRWAMVTRVRRADAHLAKPLARGVKTPSRRRGVEGSGWSLHGILTASECSVVAGLCSPWQVW